MPPMPEGALQDVGVLVTRPRAQAAELVAAIEEHGGTLTLTDAEPFEPGARIGACAVINLPLLPTGAAANKIPA